MKCKKCDGQCSIDECLNYRKNYTRKANNPVLEIFYNEQKREDI